jgi:L-fucose isomerase
MLFGHLLTGAAQIFADVRTFWSPEAVKRVTGHKLSGQAAYGVLHLINSGAAALDGTGRQAINGKPAMKPFWEITPREVKKCLEATSWHPAILEYFRGSGYSSGFLTRGGMPATMFRINLVKGFGPTMQIAEGYTADLPENVDRTLQERTNPTWPTTWFAPRLQDHGPFRDVYTVMNNWGANHCVMSYGHIGSELITLASTLRIPVSMHNVPEEEIFRPSAWIAFGARDLEGADFRACKNFGPLYGKY